MDVVKEELTLCGKYCGNNGRGREAAKQGNGSFIRYGLVNVYILLKSKGLLII